jgi:hypothetical protein
VFSHGRNGNWTRVLTKLASHMVNKGGYRIAEQAEGGKAVGVDPAVITAGKTRRYCPHQVVVRLMENY